MRVKFLFFDLHLESTFSGFYRHQCVLLFPFTCTQSRPPPEVWKLSQQKLGPLLFTGKAESVNHHRFSKVYMDAILWQTTNLKSANVACGAASSDFLIILYNRLTAWLLRSLERFNLSKVIRKSVFDNLATAVLRVREYVLDVGIAQSHMAPSLANTHAEGATCTHTHALICCFHSLTLVLLGVSGGKQDLKTTKVGTTQCGKREREGFISWGNKHRLPLNMHYIQDLISRYFLTALRCMAIHYTLVFSMRVEISWHGGMGGGGGCCFCQSSLLCPWPS